jgi:uncharacterized protein (TIGR03435 family)
VVVTSRLLLVVGMVTVVSGISGVPAAQAPASPAFDVASIKPNKSATFNRGFSMPADRFEATNAPLQLLVEAAYGEPGPPSQMLADYQVSGGPSWINTDRFDIVAKAGSDVPVGMAGARQKLLMLRTLLAERFKLTVHHETRDAPIYALVLARRTEDWGPSSIARTLTVTR